MRALSASAPNGRPARPAVVHGLVFVPTGVARILLERRGRACGRGRLQRFVVGGSIVSWWPRPCSRASSIASASPPKSCARYDRSCPLIGREPWTDTLRSLLRGAAQGRPDRVVVLVSFSTLAFRTLQRALGVIFRHRRDTHPPRPYWHRWSSLLVYVLLIGLSSLLQTIASINLDRVPFLAAYVPRWTGSARPARHDRAAHIDVSFCRSAKVSLRTALIGGDVRRAGLGEHAARAGLVHAKHPR